MSDKGLAAHQAGMRITLARYLAGEVSAEIALMNLLLACGGAGPVLRLLEPLAAHPEFTELVGAAHTHRDGLERTARLVEAGLTEYAQGSLAAMRDQFDRAVAVDPEAAVALYSFGRARTLDRATAEIVDQLLQWQVLGRDIAALDIGCGIGRIERALAPYLGAITGIDLSPAMVVEARRRCGGLGNVELACCGGADLSQFAGRRFGLVLAIDSFPCLVATDPAIAERHVADAAGLLDPGGALVIFNYSYRGSLDTDRADIAALAARHGFRVDRDGTRDLELWDGATFLLRKPPRISAQPRRG
jgi:SAM-dependent methyltransferase